MPEAALNPLARRIVKALGTQEEGEMTFIEFCRVCAVFAPKSDRDRKLKFAFRAYDADGNGKIDPEEMAEVLKEICCVQMPQAGLVQLAEGIIRRFDRDKDGSIDEKEFIMLLDRS